MGRGKYFAQLSKAERKKVKEGTMAIASGNAKTNKIQSARGTTARRPYGISTTTLIGTRSCTPRPCRSTRSASPRYGTGKHVYKLGIKLDAVAQHDVAARQLGVHAVHRGVVDEGEL